MENKITKGYLYFHLANARVERIVKVIGEKVEHRHHKSSVGLLANVSVAKDFRRATPEEIANYLRK